MGLGNSRYASGNLPAAAKTFQRAVQICPTCADAYNNLAHVLARLGYYEEALIQDREAVSLEGPDADIYRQTLEEILELKKGIEISQ